MYEVEDPLVRMLKFEPIGIGLHAQVNSVIRRAGELQADTEPIIHHLVEQKHLSIHVHLKLALVPLKQSTTGHGSQLCICTKKIASQNKDRPKVSSRRSLSLKVPPQSPAKSWVLNMFKLFQ